ncbi:MAG: nuclear transport factor 2 family protein [Flavobacteriales bacterium]|jgi:hypothetical protein|nr:nuclear transport factor 2 family protein [Flavobacteriales bacterium]
MKYLLLSLMVILSACTQSDDLALYKTNLEIVKKAISCYETPQDFETFKSLLHEDVQHQSPMYGQGVVDYDGVLGQAKFYMEGFKNVNFENPIWLPGVNDTTLVNNGSVRVYGTWTGESIETGNSFSVDSYHYFDIKDGQISMSGDYFDATGMVMAVSAPSEDE